jgi:hypothetical protein
MDTVLCIRWITDRPHENAADPVDLMSRWRRCTPPEVSQEELARRMGVLERADPPPHTAYLSFGVAIR